MWEEPGVAGNSYWELGRLHPCRSTWDSREIQPLTWACWISFCEWVEEVPGFFHQWWLLKNKKSIKPLKREKQEQGEWSDIFQLCWQQGKVAAVLSADLGDHRTVQEQLQQSGAWLPPGTCQLQSHFMDTLDSPEMPAMTFGGAFYILEAPGWHVATQWSPLMSRCSAVPGSPCLPSREVSFAIGRLWSGKDWQTECSFVPDHYTCTKKICWPTVIAYQWGIEIRSNDCVCMQTWVPLNNLWTAKWYKMMSESLLLKYSK